MEKSTTNEMHLDLSKLSYSSLRRIQTLLNIKLAPYGEPQQLIESIVGPLSSISYTPDEVINKLLKIKKDEAVDDPHSIRRSLRQKPKNSCWKGNANT